MSTQNITHASSETREKKPENDFPPIPISASRSSQEAATERPYRGLEEVLSSALAAGDKELNHVLQELAAISSALRSDKPDVDMLRAAMHPAVWRSMEHLLLERELRHLALSDDLTCLYNRRGFYAAGTQQLKLARRDQKQALLLFCDLDDLKAINDSFGHREGDRALVRTADALQEVFRDSDVLARIGGDEFAVAALGLSPQDEHTVLSRLHGSLRKAGKDELRYELSLSVGAAWFNPQKPVSLGQLMEKADRAMYARKRERQGCAGKYRIVHGVVSGGVAADAIVGPKKKM